MTIALIIKIIIALGSIAGLGLWYVKRYHSAPARVTKLQEKVDEITREIIQLEKLPAKYSRVKRIRGLYTERLQINRRISRIRAESKKN